jgi:hypothetical protein
MRKWAILAVLIIGNAVLAEMASAGVGVSAKIGTLGYGGDLTVGVLPQLNVRAGFNTFSFAINTRDDSEGATKISADLDLQTIPILLDWHPYAGGFRVSAGMVVNNNEVSLYAVPGDTVKINDVEYGLQHLDGKATFNQVAPYLGIGAGNAADTSSHLHFSCDFGVMFQGEANIELHATASNPALQTILDADVEQQRKTSEDDVSVFKFYPVIAIGLSYTF